MSTKVEHVAEGLGHPEGPDVLPDGRIVFVETYRSRLSAWSPERGVELFADCGGGPNACLLGADGAVYVTQNGGTAGPWRAAVMSTPSIQRVTSDGRVEAVVTEVGGVTLTAPNDLTFGPDGRLYFTDPGDYDPVGRPHPGYVFALSPDGSGEVLEELEPTYPNGIVAEADGSIVWVESYTLQVWRRRPDGSKEMVHQLPDGHVPDGLKVAANGDLWITAFQAGGVDVIHADGTPVRFVETGGVQCNCLLHDGWLYLTDFGDVAGDLPETAPMIGRLSRVRVDVEGMPLFRGSIAAVAA
ncbi:MAG TPA: SMP-30/gluconolactonase/LRE family protein [Conexibacter sp.]|jgi:gluconolactonase